MIMQNFHLNYFINPNDIIAATNCFIEFDLFRIKDPDFKDKIYYLYGFYLIYPAKVKSDIHF